MFFIFSHVHVVSLPATFRKKSSSHFSFTFEDPFIDDNIEFARRLAALNVLHYFIVVDEWPHGYLDFGFASNEIAQYNVEIINMMQTIVRQSISNDTGDVASVPSFTD